MNKEVKKAAKKIVNSVVDYGNGANLSMGIVCAYMGIKGKDKKLTLCGISMITAAGYSIYKRDMDIMEGGEQ